MPNYTRSNFYSDIARDASAAQNIDRIVNRAVREVISDVDLRSTKRKTYLSPVLNENQFDYQAPADLKELGLIDVRRLKDRIAEWKLVPTEEFDRRKSSNGNLVCIEDGDWVKKLRISAELDGSQLVLHECDDIDEDGTWAASGSASNLTEDSDFYLHGSASLNFDIGASYTSALLTNPDMDAVDLSDYENAGSIFAYIYIPSFTGLTSFKLRVGSSASVYFEKTVTATNENIAFTSLTSAGVHLLRFDLATATETGTVDMANVNYLRLEVVGVGTASATTDWRLDYLVIRRGIPHEVWYYTKYGWQVTGTGAYLENSTANTDKLHADTEEYKGFILKGKQLLYEDLGMDKKAVKHEKQYNDWKDSYVMKYPSEKMMLVNDYYSFESLDEASINDDDD